MSSSSTPRRLAAAGALIAAAVAGSALLAPTAVAAPAQTLEPGSVITLRGDSGAGSSGAASRCTVAYVVMQGSDPAALTAGHCGDKGTQVYLGDDLIGEISKSQAPTSLPGGLIIGGTDSPDWALIDLNNRSDVNIAPGSEKIAPTSVGKAKVGDEVCTQGSTTGWACGSVTGVNGDWVTTDIHREAGDSGGPLFRPSDGAGIGILGHIEKPLIGAGKSTSSYFDLATALRASGTKLAV